MQNKRNKTIVGHNSASYDDKHPENPVIFGPIRKAVANTSNMKLVRKIKACSNLPRPILIREVNLILFSSGCASI